MFKLQCERVHKAMVYRPDRDDTMPTSGSSVSDSVSEAEPQSRGRRQLARAGAALASKRVGHRLKAPFSSHHEAPSQSQADRR